jgi:poly(A) polymerase
MARLLAAPDPAPALAAMQAADILARVLPGADASVLPALVDLEVRADAAARWQRRLVALGWRDAWADALRLSRADRRALAETAKAVAADLSPAAAAWRHGADPARDAALIRAAEGGILSPDLEAEIARGAAANFPLSAADLAAQGPALGVELRRLEEAWLSSDLRLDAVALRGGPTVGSGSDG